MYCFIFAMSYFVDQSSFVQRLEEVLNFPPFPSSKYQSLNTVFPTLIINHCELLHSPKMNFWNKLNHHLARNQLKFLQLLW